MRENIFYVYVLLDPRKPGVYKYGEYEFDHEPFYVEKGKGDRVRGHLQKANLDHNSHKSNKIRKILRETGDDYMSVTLENMTEENAFELEIKLIQLIGRFDLNTGLLTNLTDGGDGISGLIFTEDHKRKISEARKEYHRKNPGVWSGENSPNFGRVTPEDTKQKISEAVSGEKHHNFGKHPSEETRRKMSESTKGYVHSEESRQRMSESHTGVSFSEERRRKMSKSQTGRIHSEESKQKRSESMKGRIPPNKGKSHTEETKKKMRETWRRKREANK